MKLRLIFISSLIFLSAKVLFSQSDFKPSLIINNRLDTVYGVGNISKNQEYCVFRKFDAKEYTKYFPSDIEAFRIIDGNYYVSKQVKEANGEMKWYFLEFLVNGKIDLFSIKNSGRFFIKKEGEDLLELNDNIENVKEINSKHYAIKDKKYLGYMKIYMSDAPELYPEIDKLDNLSQRELVNLSIEYHNAVCSEYKCINYTKNIPVVTYKIEVMSGATYHNHYYAPQFGILVHIWRPLRNEKLYLKTGIIYSDRPYWRKDDSKVDEYKYNIKFPISFQYVFGKGTFKPTLAFGFPTGIFLISSFQGGFIYSLSKDFEISFSSSLDGLLALPMGFHKEIYNNQLGHSINVGLIYQLK